MQEMTELETTKTQFKAADEAIQNPNEFIEALFNNINDLISIIDTNNFKIILVNGAFLNAYDLEEKDVLGKHCYEITHRRPRRCEAPDDTCPLRQTLKSGCRYSVVHIHYDKGGRKKYVEVTTCPIINKKGNVQQVAHIERDITERKQAEDALRESEERYRRLIESVTDYIYKVTVEDGQPISTSHGPGCVAVTGYTSKEYEADPYIWYRMVYEEDRQAVLEQAASALIGESTQPLEHRMIHRDGSIRWIRNTPVIHKDEQGRVISYDGFISDITERKRAEEEMKTLEEQFRQSQKMEAIGRLAGGVAHDFNNILTVIGGHCEISLLGLREEDPHRENIMEIKRVADRAANLTRQLLAFSRRQIIQAKILDLNTILKDMNKMLYRIIGEDIELIMDLSEGLGKVKTDPGQIAQVILNLAVNARDAMPSGGKLLIETANMEFDEVYARSPVGMKPGHYVMFSISDTGVGMTPEVKERISEPFFTTKEMGKGTGLGLSTVYGIVKQSGGNIWVYSEPNRGATFKIYLPRMDEFVEESGEKTGDHKTPRGRETILLVEDEKAVRKLVIEFMNKQGYTVLKACHGDEALQICKKHKGLIHLMVTDVVMPGMNGRELAENLSPLHPEMKVLYISGYTENAIIHHGVLDPGTSFLQKPFTLDVLARKVREELDRPPHPQPLPQGEMEMHLL
jgi:two-component system cell cycle sensor histidine kinase/response regulator CckA